MIVGLLLSILIAVASGWLVVRLAWRARPRGPATTLLVLCLAIAVGMGVAGEVFFLFLWATNGVSVGLPLVDVGLLAVLAAAVLYASRRNPDRFLLSTVPPPSPVPAAARRLRTALASACLVSLAVALYVTVSAFFNQPYGHWDAWITWNLKALFLFRGGEQWRDVFSTLFWGAHPEYPILLPSMVARAWRYAGREIQLAPAMLATLFTFATAGLAYAALAFLRRKGQGLLAALLLLSTPLFVRQGASQTADVPLCFYYLATVVLVVLQDEAAPEERTRFAFLAGIVASDAAWIKSEGLLFFACLIATTVVALLPKAGRAEVSRSLIAFALGALLVLPVVLYAKARLAAPDLMLALNARRRHQIVEWHRYIRIVRAFGRGGLHFGDWWIEIVPLLAFYSLLLGVPAERPRKTGVRIGIVTLALTLAGYFFVYVITYEDLDWHLRTTLHRLLLQLWPSALFLSLMLLRTPEEATAD